eukprot:scaffold512182_cov23-Prasinocladus_malaysianus.AAC.1
MSQLASPDDLRFPATLGWNAGRDTASSADRDRACFAMEQGRTWKAASTPHGHWHEVGATPPSQRPGGTPSTAASS